MKKNVKILGAAAAAALLAVAPIAAAAAPVANAATVTPSTSGSTVTSNRGTINVSLYVNDLSNIKDGASADSITGNLNATLNGQTVNVNLLSGQKVWVVPASFTAGENPATEHVNTLHKNQSYRLVTENIGFTNLVPGGTYNLAGSNGSQVFASNGALSDVHASAFGNIGGGNGAPTYTVMSDTFTPAAGTNYFTKTGQNKAIDQGSINWVDGNSVQDIVRNITNSFTIHNTNDTAHGGPILGRTNSELAASIRTALINAGINVPSDTARLDTPAGDVHVNYVVYLNNGSTATLPVTLKVNNNGETTSPYFVNKDSRVRRVAGNRFALTLPLNGSFDANELLNAYNEKSEKTSPVASIRANALQVNTHVVSNNVNTSERGNYEVVISATNVAGHTAEATVDVHVGEANETARTVSYVPGYNVYLWNINGNRASMTSSTQHNGDVVYTVGEPVTVDGVQYYKITGTENYIQARYLGEAQGNHNTNKNGETKVNGVLTVTYNGRGEVRLLSTEGRYQNQYVKRGAKFRVWASKNINGRLMYRIGTQNQWIPAEFTSFSGR